MPHVEGPPATPNHYILQRMDLLVSDERNRQIRERVRLAGGRASGPPPAARRRGRPSWHRHVFDEHYEAAVRAAGSAVVRVVAKHFRALDGDIGIDPASLARLLRRRSLPPGAKDALPE